MRASSFVIAFLTGLMLASAALAVAPGNQPTPQAVVNAAVNAAASTTPPPTGPIPGTPDADQGVDESPGPPSLFEPGAEEVFNKASVRVVLHTSRTKDAIDVFTLYPYITKPPVWVPSAPLATREQALRNLIRNSGYGNRPNTDKPYVDGGWRWYYAYKEGLRKSGKGEPHNIFLEYSFVDGLLPYVARECKLRNEFEKGRKKRYEQANIDWERTHTDLEADAVRQGLMPIALSHRDWSVGKGQFPPGTWWLQVTRKVPGLKYFWLQKITATRGQYQEVVLDDNNALAIIGGW